MLFRSHDDQDDHRVGDPSGLPGDRRHVGVGDQADTGDDGCGSDDAQSDIGPQRTHGESVPIAAPAGVRTIDGRGKTLAFPVQDSWHWQMDVKMTFEDMTHENYWRQLLRWLVDGVPSNVEVHTVADRVEPGDPVTLVAEVVDPAYVEVNDARVLAKVTGPKGTPVDVPMQWTGERNGEYRATFPATDQGMYVAQVEATR